MEHFIKIFIIFDFFQSISDREGTEDLSEEANPDSADPETEPESTESDSAAKMDLDAFLSQFVLIKTPYGYILARAPQQVTIFERLDLR
jgi:hypothetical protein